VFLRPPFLWALCLQGSSSLPPGSGCIIARGTAFRLGLAAAAAAGGCGELGFRLFSSELRRVCAGSGKQQDRGRHGRRALPDPLEEFTTVSRFAVHGFLFGFFVF